MPEIKKIDNEPIILLNISNDFLMEYIPGNEVFKDVITSKLTYLLPYKTPYAPNHDIKFLIFFLERLEKLLTDYGIEFEKHADNLLHFSNYFTQEHFRMVTPKIDDYNSNERAKILIHLLEIPILTTTKERIIQHITFNNKIEDGDLAQFENLDWNEEIERFIKQNNLTFELAEGKNMYISKDNSLHIFNEGLPENKPIILNNKGQTIWLIKSLVESILDEQKGKNTRFYQALLKMDFTNKVDTSALLDVIKMPSLQSWNFVLIGLSEIISEYLNKEKLILYHRGKNISKVQKVFLYEYFLLLGMHLSANRRDLKPYKSIEELEHAIEDYKNLVKGNPSYAEMHMKELFKSLK